MRSRHWLTIALVLFGLAAPAFGASPPVAAGGGPIILHVDGSEARLVRDAYGVPHVFAPTNRALFYACGYAVAQDRLWQMDLYRRTARGTLAEVLGASALASDVHERLHGYTEAEYGAIFASLPGETREILLAYRDGVNAYRDLALADPEHLLPWEFHQLAYLPAAWKETDSLAIARFMADRFGEQGGKELRNQALLQFLSSTYGAEVGASMFEDLRWPNDPNAPVSVPTQELPSMPATVSRLNPLPDVERIAGEVAAQDEAARDVWRSNGIPIKLGSYFWAVSPPRSATGHALLYGGPQMGFETPNVVHEVQLTGGQGFDVIGVSFAGTPLVPIGRNRVAAWSITSGMGDNTDTYVETLNPLDPDQYRFAGAWHTMITRTETISVSGRLDPVTQVVRRTGHGPIIATDQPNGLAYTLRRAHWMHEDQMLAAVLGMMRAQSLADFGDSVLQYPVSNHVIYADTAGNIAYWQAGMVPIRPGGGHVGRLPWLGDGSEEWMRGWRPTPHVSNPAQGYLANWNNKASADFDNSDASLMGQQDRVSDIVELLAADDSISWEDMRAIAMRIGTIKLLGNETRYVRSYLLSAIERLAPDDPSLQDVAARLGAWDGHLTGDAIAGATLQPEEVLWNTWLTQALLDTFSDELGSYWNEANINTLLHALQGPASGVPPSRNYFDRLSTPAIETADEILVQALREAVDLLTARFGSADIQTWLDPRPAIRYQHSLGPLCGEIPMSNRASYGQVIELSTPIRAENILPLGQSAFISPAGTPDAHFDDQLALYRTFQHKPMPLLLPWNAHLPLLLRDSPVSE